MLPYKRTSAIILVFLLPCAFSFILPEPFRSLFASDAKENTERQGPGPGPVEATGGGVIQQLIPISVIVFTISFINNIIGMMLDPEVDCRYDGDDWHWGYEGVYGPACWKYHVPACNGRKQSPIDIKSAGVSTTPEPSATPLMMSGYANVKFGKLANTGEHYHGSDDNRVHNGILTNNGHTAQLDAVSTSGGILSGGQLTGNYEILQLHFHWGANDLQGSEHTLDGVRFPLELHVVHTKSGVTDFLNTPRGLSVTGFFFEVDGDTENLALKPLTDRLANIITSEATIDFAGVNFSLVDLLSPVAPMDGTPRTSDYSTYEGSLTTPTCNEVVEWINFLQPLKISRAQLAAFRKLDDDKMKDIVDNFRPVQPLNGRTVSFWT